MGSPRPFILVSASGMLTGGRILHHPGTCRRIRGPLLLFIGYQGEGTLGRHLADGGKEARIDRATWPVRCRVRSISACRPTPTRRSWMRGSGTSPRRRGMTVGHARCT